MSQLDEQSRRDIVLKVNEHLKMLVGIYDSGRSNPDAWHKNLILLVYRLAQAGALPEAQRMISVLTGDYINTVLPRQMVEDESFGKLVMEMCATFVHAGIAIPTLDEGDLRPTQRAALA